MDSNLSPLLRFSHTELLPAPTAHAGGAGTGTTQPEPAPNGLEEATLRKAQRGSGLHVEPAGTWAWPMDSPGPRGAKTPLMQPPRLHSGACSCREPRDGRQGGPRPCQAELLPGNESTLLEHGPAPAPAPLVLLQVLGRLLLLLLQLGSLSHQFPFLLGQGVFLQPVLLGL